MKAAEKFTLGQRVEMTQRAIDGGLHGYRAKGVVKGFARFELFKKNPDVLVKVLCDGERVGREYHMDFWQPEGEEAGAEIEGAQSMTSVYLAGKVGGKKWEIAKAFPDINFRASDADDHSEHGWGFASFSFGDCYISESVQRECLDQIAACDVLVAYLNTPDSFGSIAEVAWASAHRKECYVFLETRHLGMGDLCGTPTRFLDNEEFLRMYDAYWLVSTLPGVATIEVESTEEAIGLLKLWLATDSPIERRFLQCLLAYVGPDHTLIPCAQYKHGRYRLDFAFPAYRVAVELDGHDSHSTKEQRTHDARRDRALLADGWTTIRFTGSEVFHDVEKCVRETVELLNGRRCVALAEPESAKINLQPVGD